MSAKCMHCGSPVPPGFDDPRFCCHGCASVYGLLHDEGLQRYYALADGQVTPVQAAEEPPSHAWLDAMLAQKQTDDVCSLSLDVQGIHCAACVWLMNETFQRASGEAGGEILVNPALGSVRLDWRQGAFDVRAWVEEVERFGYRFGPPRKEATRASRELPVRLGVSAAITINVMLFSISFYFGLAPGDEGFTLFSWLALALSTVTVVVGGWPFFRAAVQGLRSRVLHLDLPIALGIVLVYATSLAQFIASGARGDVSYFDTLNTFITLMLLGRFLQERVLERNRRFLLEDGGAEGLLVRRVVGTTIELVPAPRVHAGDTLWVAPGELVPVACTLLDDEARVRTDWMTGEPEPHAVREGERLLAGSFNGGASAFSARAMEDFAQSRLVELLRAPAPKQGTAHLRWWDALARRWVVTVLGAATLGLLLWLPRGVDDALRVTVSLLVITCPCAIGIAIPLAYELTKSRLRRRGFYTRVPDALDRALEVKHVVFDKTGTLTLGRLEWVNRQPLPEEVRDVAWNLAVRSSHPVSLALASALEKQGAKLAAGARVTEVAGQGVEWRRADGVWFLGKSPRSPLPFTGEAQGEGRAASGTVLLRDGALVARFEFTDVPRLDARESVRWLSENGYSLWLLSGDTQAHVTKLAASLGLDSSRAFGGCSPEDKARRLRELGAEHALYLGDGVNDALAFEAALLAGTPAIERPVMPSRSDFFLVGQGLSPLCEALYAARRLRAVVSRVLALSVAYNVLAIAASLAGLMTPLAAAISMPVSTLTLLFITVRGLRGDWQAPCTVTAPSWSVPASPLQTLR